MAVITGNEIFARSRVLATEIGGDANQSVVIDSLGGIRVLLNHSIREVFRRQSNDQKFVKDTVTRHAITIASGDGACPDEIMREFLSTQAQFQDDNNSQISYYNYSIDYSSGVNFNQLGYVCLQGDTFQYTAPAPDSTNYSGNLFVTVPSFPTFPASMTQQITFPSTSTIDSVILFLSQAITGKETFSTVTA